MGLGKFLVSFPDTNNTILYSVADTNRVKKGMVKLDNEWNGEQLSDLVGVSYIYLLFALILGVVVSF